MNMKGGNLQLSQGYEVLTPRSGKAYPVPCDEWCFLKDKLRSVSFQPWILPALSFLLFGIALTTITSILLGGINPGTSGHRIIIAWAIFSTSFLVGLSCLCLAIKQHRMQRVQVSEVVHQMELIERRFEEGEA